MKYKVNKLFIYFADLIYRIHILIELIQNCDACLIYKSVLLILQGTLGVIDEVVHFTHTRVPTGSGKPGKLRIHF